MAEDLKLSELKKTQAALQKAYNQAQIKEAKARAELLKIEEPLINFNNKYGRVLQLLGKG